MVRRSLDARKGRAARPAPARAGRARRARAGAGGRARAAPPLAGGRAGAAGSSSSARGRRARGPRCGWPRRAFRSPSSSRASRCSRGATIWRCSRAASSTPSSNYCFGEGGAGTYSDGKLYTRAKDRGGVADVIADLVRFGAPDEIAVEARPHVGSNRLAQRAARRCARTWSTLGVEYRFEADRRRAARRGRPRARGAASRAATSCPPTSSCWPSATRRGRSTSGPPRTASRSSARRSRSACASSTRSALIDEIQYGAAAGHPKLPPAFYELTSADSRSRRLQLLHVPRRLDRPRGDRARRRGGQRHEPVAPRFAVRERGPGGHRRAAPTSAPRRRGRWRASSCSGGSSRPRFAPAAAASARRRSAWPTSSPAAPAPRSARPATGPGSRPATSRRCCPPFVTDGAARGPARAWARGCPASCSPTPCWSRRRPEPARRSACCATRTRCSRPSLAGLYPCGEGAGYAGGIVSAALDGARVAARDPGGLIGRQAAGAGARRPSRAAPGAARCAARR